MKKFLTVGILIVCFVMVTLCGCSLFGGSEGSKSYTISIVYDDETQTFENLAAGSVRITPKFKSGYVLTGYYAQQDGQGEQFLDYKGKSIKSGGWKSSYPTTLYPKYELLDYDKKFTTTFAQEVPTKFTYNIYEDPKKAIYTIDNAKEKFSYILMAAYSNPEANINISVSAEVRRNGKNEGTTTFSLAIGEDIKTGLLTQSKFKPPLTFTTETLTADITGRTIANNEGKDIIIGFFWGYNGIDSYGIVKNVKLTVNFVE